VSQEWEAAVASAFEGLTEPHREKKKATIIALVDARLAGKPEETVWGRPEVCNRRTYHMKWHHDPEFAAALAEVTRLATQWKDGRVVRALQDAAERMALASPVAAMKVIALLGSADENVRLRASFGILDRAGEETASKAQPAGAQVLIYLPENGRDGDQAATGAAGALPIDAG
jgi:hypothetical protein